MVSTRPITLALLSAALLLPLPLAAVAQPSNGPQQRQAGEVVVSAVPRPGVRGAPRARPEDVADRRPHPAGTGPVARPVWGPSDGRQRQDDQRLPVAARSFP